MGAAAAPGQRTKAERRQPWKEHGLPTRHPGLVPGSAVPPGQRLGMETLHHPPGGRNKSGVTGSIANCDAGRRSEKNTRNELKRAASHRWSHRTRGQRTARTQCYSILMDSHQWHCQT